MTMPETFGTDPNLLTRDQLIQYVQQLKRTVYRWQDIKARQQGFKNREYWYNEKVKNR